MKSIKRFGDERKMESEVEGEVRFAASSRNFRREKKWWDGCHLCGGRVNLWSCAGAWEWDETRYVLQYLKYCLLGHIWLLYLVTFVSRVKSTDFRWPILAMNTMGKPGKRTASQIEKDPDWPGEVLEIKQYEAAKPGKKENNKVGPTTQHGNNIDWNREDSAGHTEQYMFLHPHVFSIHGPYNTTDSREYWAKNCVTKGILVRPADVTWNWRK